METITYITYDDVIKATNEKTLSPKKFYKQEKFKGTFKNTFNFKDIKIIDLMLNNWNNAIKEEIELNEDFVSKIEQSQIKRLSLREMTKIINIGKYATEKLKMKSEIALAFTLGIFYGTYIFEGTGMYLTIEQIYNIIPLCKRTKNGYKVFQKRFFIDGTNEDITKILYNKQI